MAAAAVIGMGLSVIGVFLVWTTFRETKEGNVIARLEVQRAEREAAAARKHIIQTERAILSVRYISAEPVSEGDAFIKLRFHIGNQGLSNAWNIQIAQHVRLSRVFPARFSVSPPLSMIALGGSNATTPIIRMRVPKSFPAFLSGYVSYTTAHDATFKTFYIYRLDGLPAPNNYNETTPQPVDVSSEVEIPSNT